MSLADMLTRKGMCGSNGPMVKQSHAVADAGFPRWKSHQPCRGTQLHFQKLEIDVYQRIFFSIF